MQEIKSSTVGLDIGTKAIKILELSKQQGNNVLLAFGYRDIQDVKKSEIAASVRELAEKSKISSKDAAISVSGPSVIARFITMPNMDKEALDGAIKFEAEKFVPFDINSCIIDYKILKKDSPGKKLNIVLVAVKREIILDRIKLAEDAGFHVRVVDVDSFSVSNAFLANFPKPNPEKTNALINIGAHMTNLCIVRGEAMCFARDIAIGSGDFIAAVAKRMGIDPKAADELITSAKDKSQDVIDTMKAVFGNLLEEAKRSFNYYENQGGRGIDEIFISGGGVGLFGLNEVFSESFGAKPSLWKPLAFLDKSRLEGSKDELGLLEGSFAIAAGLALR